MRKRTIALVLLLLLLGGAGVWRWWRSRALSAESGGACRVLAAPLPQDPAIRVAFNQAVTGCWQERDRPLTRNGDDLEQIILEAIAAATQSVDVAVQELRLPRIAAELVAQHRAGRRVRVILENQYSRPWSSYAPEEIAALAERDRQRIEEYWRLGDLDGDGRVSQTEAAQQDALVVLARAGVPLIDDRADGSKGSGLMHHKFVVIDGQRAIVTSANFTPSDIYGDLGDPATRGNANNLLDLASPELAVLLTEEFELLWGDGPGGRSDSVFGVKKPYRPPRTVTVGAGTITVQFSPTSRRRDWADSTNGTIAATVSQAGQAADLALFVFSEQAIADALDQARSHGAEIRALIDPRFAFRDYSEGLDLLGATLPNRRCELEPDNRPWNPAIATVGTPRLIPGDLLHHKFAVLDQQTVLTGSHNWSAAANQSNDETLLIIRNPTVAQHFTQEFERLYQDARLGLSQTVRDRIDQSSCP